jgi:hypothetical protein
MKKIMRSSIKLPIAIGLVFLAVAWWLSYSAEQKHQNFNPTPLSQNVSIKQGVLLDALFQTDMDERYEINLDVDRKMPKDKIDCLLGIAFSAVNKCSESKNVISMSWEVRSGEQIVAKGESNPNGGGYWRSGSIGRQIGQFHAKAGTNYLLEVRSAMDGGELNAANPRIKVTVNATRGKQQYVGSTLSSVASIVLACLGGSILLLMAIVVLFRKIRPDNVE